MPSANTPLNGLTNIGPTIAARLEAVGIKTVGDLRRVGGLLELSSMPIRLPQVDCDFLVSCTVISMHQIMPKGKPVTTG